MLDARFGIVLGLLAYLVIPAVFEPRPFDANAPFAWLLELERSDGMEGRASLPSFHVFWVIMAARAAWQRTAIVGILASFIGLLIALSCITTGMHSTLDVVTGAALAGAAGLRATTWRFVLTHAERIANSWREWRVGPARVLSHAVFPGVAAALGIAIAGWRLGVEGAYAVALLAVLSLIGACAWGQYWTGSSKLLRPFGYFGSIVALAAAIPLLAVLWPAQFNGWLLAATLALAAPWIQSIGRLRCLVQGCCHGRAVDGCTHGIRYRHPRSRVVVVAGLRDVAVHATPVYSILSNIAVGLLLWRLAALHQPQSFLVGAYLLLSGLSRFVEESLRGEPQTRVIAGLRFYQWCAVASVLLGTSAMSIRSDALPSAVGCSAGACAPPPMMMPMLTAPPTISPRMKPRALRRMDRIMMKGARWRGA